MFMFTETQNEVDGTIAAVRPQLQACLFVCLVVKNGGGDGGPYKFKQALFQATIYMSFAAAFERFNKPSFLYFAYSMRAGATLLQDRLLSHDEDRSVEQTTEKQSTTSHEARDRIVVSSLITFAIFTLLFLTIDLANERTYLAWMRTSLSVSTVGFALFKLGGEQFYVVGLALVLWGAITIGYGLVGCDLNQFRVFHILIHYRYLRNLHALSRKRFEANKIGAIVMSFVTFGLIIAVFVLTLVL